MKPALVDVSVLLIFFNRPEPFEKVFRQVREARPSRLFLYQDGPRNEKDLEGILRCREIVSNIDWECEVHTFFQKENKGCDPSGYLADTWAFSLTDKCIILEDDCVPSATFFSFCKKMLDKYENDPRVWMISGFNHEEITKEVHSSYFFSEFMSIWGWATWRRVIEAWDASYGFLDNPIALKKISSRIEQRRLRRNFLEFCKQHRDSGKAHFESILWSSMILNDGLAVMPRHNMVNNIGISAESTHFSTPAHMLPRGYRKIFTMPRYEIDEPIVHPSEIRANYDHQRHVYRILAWDHPSVKISRSLEELLINLRYGNFKNIKSAALKRLCKLLSR